MIWDFIGEPFDQEEVEALHCLELALEPEGELNQSLEELLSEDEIVAMRQRLRYLLEQRVFPEPDPARRPIPWPLV